MPRLSLIVFAVAAMSAGCAKGPSVEGKWCITVGGEAHTMTVKAGRMTADNGKGGTYTVSGNKVTTTEDDGGAKSDLILSEDGKSMVLQRTLSGERAPTFTRCD